MLALYFLSLLLSFVGGAVWCHFFIEKRITKSGCPFKYACLQFDTVETKKAVKRVLTLLMENKVSKTEIHSIIDKTLH